MSNRRSICTCFFWQLPHNSGQLKITTLRRDMKILMKVKKKNKLRKMILSYLVCHEKYKYN